MTLVKIHVAETEDITCLLEKWVWIWVWRLSERMDFHKLLNFVSIQQLIWLRDVERTLQLCRFVLTPIVLVQNFSVGLLVFLWHLHARSKRRRIGRSRHLRYQIDLAVVWT